MRKRTNPVKLAKRRASEALTMAGTAVAYAQDTLEGPGTTFQLLDASQALRTASHALSGAALLLDEAADAISGE